MTSSVHNPSLSIFLGLSQVKGIGFKTMRDLGGPLGVAELQASGGLLPLITSLTGIDQAELGMAVRRSGALMRRALHARDVVIVTQQDALYPIAFRSLPDELQPLWLFCRGDLSLLQRPAVAVVGTRDPTPEGEFLTRYAAYSAAEAHLPLVSGLALGVDGIAHETALQARVPNISVLGTGILRAYPARNSWMADAIVGEGGLLISEYFPEAGPLGEQFVWRNRLQAALASCVVAPQWKKTSGTAHTIRFAKNFGRPSINLVPNGLKQADDHGQADLRFEVPKQHTLFMDCVIDSTRRWPHGELALQPSLFG